jgi:hypothetical protein
MADFPAEEVTYVPLQDSQEMDSFPGKLVPLFQLAVSTPVAYYKMRALADPGPGYLVWVVQTNPDFSGTQAPGAIIAGSAVIAASWMGT